MLASQGVSFHVVLVTSAPVSEHQQFLTEFGADRRFTYWYEPGGPAHKRNYGVTHGGRVQSPYLIFLDDDVEVSPHCLSAFVQWMEAHPRCGMAFAKILNMERRREFDDCGSWITWTGFLWARAGNLQHDHGQADTVLPILSSKSATCVVRRDSFYATGGFDADYFILAEESDLAWRCWLRGWEVWYVPTATSWHAFNTILKHPADYYSLTRIHRLGSRNYLKLLTTNLGASRLLRILPVHLLGWTVACLGYLLSGQWQRAYCVAAGVWDWLRGLPGDLVKRKHVQGSRVVSDRVLWPRISAAPPLGYYVDRMRRYLVQGLHG